LGYQFYQIKTEFTRETESKKEILKEKEKLENLVKKYQKENKLLKEKEKALKEKIEAIKNEIEDLEKKVQKLKVLKEKKKFYLPILVYHHIEKVSDNTSPLKRKLSVSPLIFEKQMEYLFLQNYHPITFCDLEKFIFEGKSLSERSLIVTFDDGWLSQYKNALPILKKYKFPAVFFIVTDYVGGSSFMNWEQLENLKKNGMEIGSHSVSHPDLTLISPPKLDFQIKNSKLILEKKLNLKIKAFAYPYGNYNSKVIATLKKHGYLFGRTVLTLKEKKIFWQSLDNLYALKAIQVPNSLKEFKNLFPPKE